MPYNSSPVAAGVGGGGLAYTGTNSLFLALAAFTLISVGLALWRVAYRRPERGSHE